MQYAGSSYAVGTGRQGGMRGYDGDVVTSVLPPPPPSRVHWSTMLCAAGMAVCFVALIATVLGVPGRMGYDIDAAGTRNKPTSSDPMALTRSLDANMKWIDEHSSESKGGYVGYITSINESEAAIPKVVGRLGEMQESVDAIDASLGRVGATTAGMRRDMEAMAATSASSADAMDALGADLGFLSRSMTTLASSTLQLTHDMATIERKAAGIAANGTSVARSTAAQLNASLPNGIPDPIISRDAAGGGGPAPGTGGAAL